MRLFLFLSLPLYVLDQITKILILKNFEAPNELTGTDHVTVIPGFFDLVRVHNTGIAFGRFNEGATSNIIFTCVTLVALVIIALLWQKNAFPTLLGKLAIALLVSGILGNLTDRLWHGYVVDFLHFYVGEHAWPSFNVADSCICVAAAFLFLTAFQKEPPSEEKDIEA